MDHYPSGCMSASVPLPQGDIVGSKTLSGLSTYIMSFLDHFWCLILLSTNNRKLLSEKGYCQHVHVSLLNKVSCLGNVCVDTGPAFPEWPVDNLAGVTDPQLVTPGSGLVTVRCGWPMSSVLGTRSTSRNVHTVGWGILPVIIPVMPGPTATTAVSTLYEQLVCS